MDGMDAIKEAISKYQDLVNADIERAVEQAIQGGKHGVLVVNDRLGMHVSADVNPNVPYGYMYITGSNYGSVPPPTEGS